MKAGTLRVKHWKQFQHYKHRSPPWIKLHRSLLDDRPFQDLDAGAGLLLVNLWLIGSENDGEISYDSSALAWRLRKSVQEIRTALNSLIRAGFLEVQGEDASIALALRLQGADPEKSRGETEERQRHTAPAALDYATRCVIAVNAILEEKLAGAYRPLVADVERPVALEWEQKGVPAELAVQVLADVTRRFRSTPASRQPNSLGYFTNALLEAHAAAQANGAAGAAVRDPVGAELTRIGKKVVA